MQYVALNHFEYSATDNNSIDYIEIFLDFVENGQHKTIEVDLGSHYNCKEFLNLLPKEAFEIQNYEAFTGKVKRDLSAIEVLEFFGVIAYSSQTDINKYEIENKMSAHKYLYEYLAPVLAEKYSSFIELNVD